MTTDDDSDQLEAVGDTETSIDKENTDRYRPKRQIFFRAGGWDR